MITKEQKFAGTRTQINTACTICTRSKICSSKSNLWICNECDNTMKSKAKTREKLTDLLGLNSKVLIDLELKTEYKLKKIKAVLVPENYTPIVLKHYEKLDIFDIDQVTKDLKENTENRILLGVIVDESLGFNARVNIGIFQDKSHDNKSISIMYEDNQLESHIHVIGLA
jgi:hypothetical protein